MLIDNEDIIEISKWYIRQKELRLFHILGFYTPILPASRNYGIKFYIKVDTLGLLRHYEYKIQRKDAQVLIIPNEQSDWLDNLIKINPAITLSLYNEIEKLKCSHLTK